MKRLVPVFVVLGLVGCLKRTEQPQIEGHDIRVTFIHTSDIHSRLLPYGLDVGETDESLGLDPSSPTVGGAARATAIIKSIRSAGGRVIHVDTGDVFQGAPIFNLFKGEVEFKWMNMLGVDAFVIGNHEFDAGISNFVDRAVQFARFPMLNANYGLEDPNVFGASELGLIAKPYTIVNVQGLRVAVIGLGSLSSIVSMYDGGNSLGVTPLDTIQMTQYYIDFLRPIVDVVVAASHLGLRGQKKMTRGSEDQIDDCEGPNCTDNTTDTCSVVHRLIGDEELIRHTEGLDLVLGGHLHIVINPPELIEECDPDPACAGQPFYEQLQARGCMSTRARRRVPLMHSGAFLKFVGQLDVIFHRPDPLPDETQAETWLREMNGWDVKTYRPDLHPVDHRVDRERWDVATERLLEPFSSQLFREIQLTRFIAYSPRKIRRFATGWGDSELGNLVANAIQTRNRVEAHFGLTNTLGIRADITRGPITEEMMYNVFPFENS
ncbi:MAG: bifunctional UDP-sugar hydrolase/5'-nucleotidase, partial [bacterium]